VTFRPARSQDAEGVAAIWNHYIRDTTVTFNPVEKTVAEVAETIATRPAFFVAERDGRIIGFSTYGAFRPGIGNIRSKEHSILLAPDAAGQGLGRALLTAVEDHARGAGVHTLFGGVSAENAAGRAFHARMGYAEAAILHDVGWKFGRYIDLVLMQKILD
jgi:L-amino acid N-acyltransferase YncA